MDGEGWEGEREKRGDEEDVVYRGKTKKNKRLSPPLLISKLTRDQNNRITKEEKHRARRETKKRGEKEGKAERSRTERVCQITDKVLFLISLSAVVVVETRPRRVEIQMQSQEIAP